MARQDMKVIIVGGALTGLTLAIMLEQLGIDFELLESHPEICPDVGAGIFIWPDGSRILDQLGCLDTFPVDGVPMDGFSLVLEGKELFEVGGQASHSTQRYESQVISSMWDGD